MQLFIFWPQSINFRGKNDSKTFLKHLFTFRVKQNNNKIVIVFIIHKTECSEKKNEQKSFGNFKCDIILASDL
jgi:hypothetical protein